MKITSIENINNNVYIELNQNNLTFRKVFQFERYIYIIFQNKRTILTDKSLTLVKAFIDLNEVEIKNEILLNGEMIRHLNSVLSIEKDNYNEYKETDSSEDFANSIKSLELAIEFYKNDKKVKKKSDIHFDLYNTFEDAYHRIDVDDDTELNYSIAINQAIEELKEVIE